MELVLNISGCAIENQVKFATCTLLGAVLTWWNGQIRTLGPETYAMTWEVLKKKMTDKGLFTKVNKARGAQIHWGSLFGKSHNALGYSTFRCYPDLGVLQIGIRAKVIENQVSVLQARVMGEEKIMAAFEVFKKHEDERGMIEGLKYGVEHGKVGLELIVVEAYDPEADKQLKDAPLDVIMASLYLDSDTGEDAPQFIRDFRPSSSQLKIPVYPEVRSPRNPWACKEEILLEDAITANKSRAEKKRKNRVVCRTHGVSLAHHARSDGILVSVPTVAPQGLQILLADAATQTEDEESPRLLRSKSLPPMFNLDWP
ncbi:hypothetical protein Tco_0439020 [Tanacetum coccineum]